MRVPFVFCRRTFESSTAFSAAVELHANALVEILVQIDDVLFPPTGVVSHLKYEEKQRSYSLFFIRIRWSFFFLSFFFLSRSMLP